MLNHSGDAVGVTIAELRRRGRVITAAPRSVREILRQAAVSAAGAVSASLLNGNDFPRYGDALREELTVVKVICLVVNPRRRPTF